MLDKLYEWAEQHETDTKKQKQNEKQQKAANKATDKPADKPALEKHEKVKQPAPKQLLLL